MAQLFREFVSLEKRVFGFQIGEHLASALSGFVAGAVVATIIWGAAVLIFLGYLAASQVN